MRVESSQMASHRPQNKRPALLLLLRKLPERTRYPVPIITPMNFLTQTIPVPFWAFSLMAICTFAIVIILICLLVFAKVSAVLDDVNTDLDTPLGETKAIPQDPPRKPIGQGTRIQTPPPSQTLFEQLNRQHKFTPPPICVCTQDTYPNSSCPVHNP